MHESTRARPRPREHHHEHPSTTTSTRARARAALEHEHEDELHSRARARALQHQHEVGRHSARAVSTLLNEMRNPSEIFSTCAWVCMGLDGSFYALGMLPRGYLPIFATLSTQSTSHGPRPGPTLAPWCSGGLPAGPGAEGTRKDPRPEEENADKNADVQKTQYIRTAVVI